MITILGLVVAFIGFGLAYLYGKSNVGTFSQFILSYPMILCPFLAGCFIIQRIDSIYAGLGICLLWIMFFILNCIIADLSYEKNI